MNQASMQNNNKQNDKSISEVDKNQQQKKVDEEEVLSSVSSAESFFLYQTKKEKRRDFFGEQKLAECALILSRLNQFQQVYSSKGIKSIIDFLKAGTLFELENVGKVVYDCNSQNGTENPSFLFLKGSFKVDEQLNNNNSGCSQEVTLYQNNREEELNSRQVSGVELVGYDSKNSKTEIKKCVAYSERNIFIKYTKQDCEELFNLKEADQNELKIKKNSIRELGIFSQCSFKQITLLTLMASSFCLCKGEKIFSQGDSSKGFFYLQQGELEVILEDEEEEKKDKLNVFSLLRKCKNIQITPQDMMVSTHSKQVGIIGAEDIVGIEDITLERDRVATIKVLSHQAIVYYFPIQAPYVFEFINQSRKDQYTRIASSQVSWRKTRATLNTVALSQNLFDQANENIPQVSNQLLHPQFRKERRKAHYRIKNFTPQRMYTTSPSPHYENQERVQTSFSISRQTPISNFRQNDEYETTEPSCLNSFTLNEIDSNRQDSQKNSINVKSYKRNQMLQKSRKTENSFAEQYPSFNGLDIKQPINNLRYKKMKTFTTQSNTPDSQKSRSSLFNSTSTGRAQNICTNLPSLPQSREHMNKSMRERNKPSIVEYQLKSLEGESEKLRKFNNHQHDSQERDVKYENIRKSYKLLTLLDEEKINCKENTILIPENFAKTSTQFDKSHNFEDHFIEGGLDEGETSSIDTQGIVEAEKKIEIEVMAKKQILHKLNCSQQKQLHMGWIYPVEVFKRQIDLNIRIQQEKRREEDSSLLSKYLQNTKYQYNPQTSLMAFDDYQKKKIRYFSRNKNRLGVFEPSSPGSIDISSPLRPLLVTQSAAVKNNKRKLKNSRNNDKVSSQQLG